ncbi:unnamed protein product [Cuscuta epithymum]|uniref:Retrotransposon gag domain-containing protein n=1 Tax=Cuscuta epithymum TaxID=186058 RepID=A0AAV0EUY1_9ASTE|nr:unnamed protein product [Cuscuta epithymum]
MVVSWLLNIISPEVKATLSNYEDARRLWNDLKERFGSVDGPKIHQVKTDLARCVQSKGMDIGTYYAKLQNLWEELNNYEPLIACKCNNCTCDVLKQHEKRRESERLHQFLMGLYTDYFGGVRSQLLTQPELPTLNRAYQQMTQEERVRGIVQAQEERPEVLGFALKAEGKSAGRGAKPDKSGLVCSYCKFTGHEITSCFELHGYPDWWGDRPRLGIKGGGRGRASISGLTGNSGTSRGKQINKAHATVAADAAAKQGQNAGDNKTKLNTPLPGFTSEQWASLLSMLGNTHSTNDRMAGPCLEEADWNG